MKLHSFSTKSISALLLAVAAAFAPASAQEAVPVFVTLTRATPRGTPPSALTIDAPGNGWDFSAAAPVAGSTWNRVYAATQTPSPTGNWTEEVPFVLNSLNDAQLYSASGALSSVRLTGVILGTHASRAEPTDASVGEAIAPRALLDAYWRMFDGNAYFRFTFTGLAPSTHYLLYCYASTANQGGKYILHPANFPSGKTSDFIYPGLTGDENKTSFVDLAGHAGTSSLFRAGSDGKTTIIPAAVTNTPAVTNSNTMWGALHAVSTASGQLVFRTDTSALGNRRQYAGFQLVPYPAPTILEQPDSETVGVLEQITEFFAVAKDLPFLSDTDQNPLTYQWQVSKDNGATWVDIAPTDERLVASTIREPALPTDPGVTPEPARRIVSVLTINGTQQSDVGRYRLRVTNVAGRVTDSAVSALSVIGQPAPFLITQQPQALDAVVGDSVSLSVGVSGTAPFAFVWQKSDTPDFATFTVVKESPRGAAASDTLSFPFIRRSDLGYYRAVVTDVTRRNPISSEVVHVYVEYAAPIITPPAAQTVRPGGAISLFGNVYSEIPVLSYQWQISRDNGATWTDIVDGGVYLGATTETLYLTAITANEAGRYRLVAVNAMGTTIGAVIPLAVTEPIVGHPVSVAVDDTDNLYVTDDSANIVHQFNLAAGTAVTFAGRAGVTGSANGYYSQATFNAPMGAVGGPANTIFLADSFNATIRYLQANGLVGNIAGSTTVRDNIDGTGAAAAFNSPRSVALDAAGNLYVADSATHTLRRITPLNFDVTTLAGSAGNAGFVNSFTTNSDYNTATRFNAPGGLVVSPVNFSTTGVPTAETPTTTATTLYVADTGNNVIRKVALTWYLDRDPLTNVQTRTRLSRNEVTTLAGLAGASGTADGAALDARFNGPTGIAVDAAGAIYVADTGNHTIRKIVIGSTGAATVTTIGGLPGISGYQDGPDADSSLFNQPRAVTVDLGGNVYVADTGNAAVRKISPTGVISTLVFARGTDPVPPTTTDPGTPTTPTIPPGGSGDRGGDLKVGGGGGAPSYWFFGLLSVLTALRYRRSLRAWLPALLLVASVGFVMPGRAVAAPAITVQPVSQIVNEGASVTFTVAHGGSATYQWFRDGAAIPGATAASHVIANAQTTASGTYHVVLTDDTGSTTSAIVTLTVESATPLQAAFVTLTRTAYAGNGVPVATNIAAPGNGWNYSAAAPYPGTTWNAAYVATGAVVADGTFPEEAPFRINSLNAVPLVNPTGAASGIVLTGDLIVVAPRAGEPTNFAAAGGLPAGLMDKVWRINNSGNLLRLTFAGLRPGGHYLFYGYAANGNVNQGARYTLDAANHPAGVTQSFIDLTGRSAATTAPNLFTTAGGQTAPIPGAVLNAPAVADNNAQWGSMHAVAGVDGRLVVRTGRSALSQHYFNGFQLIPYPLPAIATQPVAEILALPGQSVTLAVTATPFAPADPLHYQWRKDGVPINTALNPTADTASLTLPAVAIPDAGSYTVAVTSVAGTVVSNASLVNVQGGEVAPTFTAHPAAAITVVGGASATFTAAATGTPVPTFQWQKDGAPILGATGATYTIPVTQLTDSGSYTLVATNSAGSATSSASVLTVRDPLGLPVVADGFARAVTGGAGGETYVVTNAADLNARLQLAAPAIITVVGTIDVRGISSARRVDVKSNKTLQGADANATIIGNINISGVQNVIVRGLNITNPGTILENGTGPRYVDGGDGVTIQNSSGVLVTHCTFYDCADGMCDLTYNVENATISWCKFYYTDAQASHRFTMILGNEATTVPITATLHHNWWAARCDQRMPASTTARGHLFNNYFTCAGNYYASNARDNAQLFVEHSYYGPNVNDPVGKSPGASALIRTIGNLYDGTSGMRDPGTDVVFTPVYSYRLDTAAAVPELVSAHAGNTGGAYSATPAAAEPVTVLGAPEAVFAGESVTLRASIAGAASYQWRFQNMDLVGATAETLVLNDILGSQLGDYTVVVGDGSGQLHVSAPATLVAGAAPIIPGSSGGPATVVSGKNVQLRANVSGEHLTYRWQRLVNGDWVDLTDGANYQGTGTNTLSVLNAGSAQIGDYRLVATNPSGFIASGVYTLAVTPPIFPNPAGIAVDAFGTLYVSDSALNVVRRVAANGIATLHAGLPNTAGYQDGALGRGTLNAPNALAIDAFGNLYVGDAGNATVRTIARDGTITTLAGDPTQRGPRDGIGTAALFSLPSGASFDRTNGVTYLADTNNHTIRRLTPQAPQVGLFVGNTVATISGAAGQSGDVDVPAVTLPLAPGETKPDVALTRYNHPAAVAFAGSYLYVADTGNNTIRRISLASGDNQFTTATLAGTPGVTGSDDGTGLEALFNQPRAIVADASGSVLYVADTGNNAIRRITAAGVVTTLAGLPGIGGLADGTGENALFNRPTALALDVAGTTLYVADAGNAAIRKIFISGNTALVTTLSIATVDDSVPPPTSGGGTTPPFVPVGDSSGTGGGGGAPSVWFLALTGALALVRFFSRWRGSA